MAFPYWLFSSTFFFLFYFLLSFSPLICWCLGSLPDWYVYGLLETCRLCPSEIKWKNQCKSSVYAGEATNKCFLKKLDIISASGEINHYLRKKPVETTPDWGCFGTFGGITGRFFHYLDCFIFKNLGKKYIILHVVDVV